jgi:hypothetical protein
MTFDEYWEEFTKDVVDKNYGKELAKRFFENGRKSVLNEWPSYESLVEMVSDFTDENGYSAMPSPENISIWLKQYLSERVK